MTRLVIFYILILLLCITFNNVFAQKVIVKDATGNTLIEINDEGTFGSITIPDSIGPPPATTNKLYNVNGTLNFNGTALGATGATDINGLSDGKTIGNSVFLGNLAGSNDIGYNNTAVGVSSFYSNTTGRSNTAIGYSALYSNTSGVYNTANGSKALYLNTAGRSNVANGNQALYSNTTGNHNVANGTLALYSNATGSYNTATGNTALYLNTIGSNNVANGVGVLYSNTSGQYNTAIGASSLYSNTIGNNNTASGYNSLYLNTTGSGNVANGTHTLYSNTSGSYNTAVGDSALYSNTDGNNNIAIGGLSLFANTSGKSNTAVGKAALSVGHGNRNTAIGRSALHSNTGNRAVAVGYQSQQYIFNISYSSPPNNYNTSVGYQSLRGSDTSPNFANNNSAFGYQALFSNSDGNSNVAIGFKAGYYETGSDKLYIANSSTSTPLIWGNFSTRKIVINGNGASNSNGRTFFSNGQAGGTTAWFNDSDRRLKKNISTIPNALEKIKKLRGVNYQWKNTKNRSEGTKMGFIAQEAIKVIPEVVDDSGDHYSMQYAPITALLVEAVKEQQKNIKEQELRIKKLEEENKILNAVVNENKSLRSEISIIKAALNKIVTEGPEVKVSIK